MVVLVCPFNREYGTLDTFSTTVENKIELSQSFQAGKFHCQPHRCPAHHARQQNITLCTSRLRYDPNTLHGHPVQLISRLRPQISARPPDLRDDLHRNTGESNSLPCLHVCYLSHLSYHAPTIYVISFLQHTAPAACTYQHLFHTQQQYPQFHCGCLFCHFSAFSFLETAVL